jgi:molybdopterin molybdotransferase
MTGAPIPSGADTVIRVEDTVRCGELANRINCEHPISPGAWNAPYGEIVQINVSAPVGKDIRCRGESLRTGQKVLGAHTEITPGVLGILAMVKCVQVEVYRLPTVAILSSGDELEGLHDPFDANKIPDANSYTLMAQVQALGIQPDMLGVARDNSDDLREKLAQGLQYDVLLVSGGTSVGVHDLVRPTLEQLGVEMHFWRVKMRPGHPAAFGTTASCRIFCLPGNPVASMVSFEQLVAPVLRHLMGNNRIFRRTLQARLTKAIKHRPGNLEFVRVILSQDGQDYCATPTGTQSSGVLLSMAQADGLLIVSVNTRELAAGELVTVQLLDGTAYQQDNGIQEET